jgi:hypothetical protein
MTGSRDRGSHARCAFPHGCFGQPHHVDARQLRVDADLDLDGHSVDTRQHRTEHACHGGSSWDRGFTNDGVSDGWAGREGQDRRQVYEDLFSGARVGLLVSKWEVAQGSKRWQGNHPRLQ